jgi:Protein of unknown function (DUF1260).
MERDVTRFPNDENGDVLWRIAQRGADLTEEREIDFAVVFPTREAALEFGVFALQTEAKVSFSAYEDEEFPWQIYVHAVMEPTHSDISEFEAFLGARAEQLGGRSDGWGFGS